MRGKETILIRYKKVLEEFGVTYELSDCKKILMDAES